MSHPKQKLDLLFIRVTTARISSQLESFVHEQKGLIVVDRVAVEQLCPLLEMVPELYTTNPETQISLLHVQLGAVKALRKSLRDRQ